MYVSEPQLPSCKLLLDDCKGSKNSPGAISHSEKGHEGAGSEEHRKYRLPSAHRFSGSEFALNSSSTITKLQCSLS